MLRGLQHLGTRQREDMGMNPFHDLLYIYTINTLYR